MQQPPSKVVPNDPDLLIFTFLCVLSHIVPGLAGLWDQQHTEEMRICFFCDQVRKDNGHCFVLFFSLILITCYREGVIGMSGSLQGGLWGKEYCQTSNKELRPGNNHRTELESGFSSPFELSDGYIPGWQPCLQPREGSRTQTTQLRGFWIPDLQKLFDIMNDNYLKLLSFGITCYTTVDNQYI